MKGQPLPEGLEARLAQALGMEAGALSGLPAWALTLRDLEAMDWKTAARICGLDQTEFAAALAQGRLAASASKAKTEHDLGGLAFFMDGEGRNRRREQVREHLETCADCHHIYRAMASGALKVRKLEDRGPEGGWSAPARAALAEEDRLALERKKKREALMALPFDPPLGLYINGGLLLLLLLTAFVGRSGLSVVLGWLTPDSKPEKGLLEGVTIRR